MIKPSIYEWGKKSTYYGLALAVLYGIGFSTLKGQEENSTIIERVSSYRVSAEKGNSSAMVKLGNCYRDGKGVEKNEIKAVKWYRRAVKKSNHEALYSLGEIYAQCYREKRSIQKLAMEKSKEKVFAQGKELYMIGQMYDYGSEYDFELKDTLKSKRWYHRAAKLGDDRAMHCLGEIYENMDLFLNMEPNYAQAIAWYRKAIEKGNSHSMYNLSMMYISGEGVEKDYAKALELSMRAAELKNQDAILYLAFIHSIGKYGVEKNYSTALMWYKKAAKLGKSDAMYRIGWIYAENKEDDEQAIGWYTKAIEKGHVNAKVALAMLYIDRKKSKEKYVEARRLLRNAAELKNIMAMVHLGDVYRKGEAGVKKSNTTAFAWYKQAAELGDIDAMYYVARMYDDGEGVKEDDQAALEWYTKAKRSNKYILNESEKKYITKRIQELENK